MATGEKYLDLKSIIGFGGETEQGLIKHPNGIHSIYPLGSTVVIRNDHDKNDLSFLRGHTDIITCLAISKNGKYVASGQQTHMGFQADILVWDFEKRQQINKLCLHKVKVQALAFSPSNKYLASLGGEDDGSVIIWDLAKGAAICGASASKESSGVALSLAYYNQSDDHFVTGGHSTLRVWEIQAQSRKVRPFDVQTGQIKRVVQCIGIDSKDEFMYCGTTTGDLLQVNLSAKLFKKAGPPKEKELFSKGISSVTLVEEEGVIVVGSGAGVVASLKLGSLQVVNKCKVEGNVSSIAFDKKKHLHVGTNLSNIYKIPFKTWQPTLTSTGHYARVNDFVFPGHSSDIIATASINDIRVWNLTTSEELLRISVPNMECLCIAFKKDGTSLITGWTDGKIRAYGPQSGRLQYTINDAHQNGVTALAIADDAGDGDFRIISGGGDGQVRIWKITRHTQNLEIAMKEHKETVTCIKIRKNNLECVSSSSDGSCIIWDLTRFVRNQVLFAPSFFKAVCYYPDESQLLTSGTDRKVAYWEAFDGSLIREIEGSQSDSINGLDISANGKYFVIGGSDKHVKVYEYEEGDVIFTGIGHSTDIIQVRISPDQKSIVSSDASGAIFSWKFPFDS